jgi:hypothetical protein
LWNEARANGPPVGIDKHVLLCSRADHLDMRPFMANYLKSSKVFPWGTMCGKGWNLFFRSEAPGLVFSAEKDGGLPPVASEKAPALPFIKLCVRDHFMGLCKHF